MDERNGMDEREAAVAALANAQRASAPAAMQVKRALRRRFVYGGMALAALPLVMKTLDGAGDVAYGVGVGVFLAVLLVINVLVRRGPVRLDEWRMRDPREWWLPFAVTFLDWMLVIVLWGKPWAVVICTAVTLAAWGHAAWRIGR